MNTLRLTLFLSGATLALLSCAFFGASQEAPGEVAPESDARPQETTSEGGTEADQSPAGVLQDAEAHLNRGRELYVSGDYLAAIADLDQAISLDALNGSAYFYRGRAYYKVGNYEAAMADLDKAIALDPQNGDAYFHRGRSHYKVGNYEAAIADLGQAITIEPQNARAYYYRGRTYYKLGNY